MAAIKHVGKVKNTGRKCIVIFREMYDDRGNVVDPDNCLVLETESLPDAEHQEIMRILESNQAQATGEVFNVFARERLSNGMVSLNWMHSSGRLRKFPTSNIVMTPDSRTRLELDRLNTIVRMQNNGASEEQIQNALQDDTDSAPRELKEPLAESVAEPVAQPSDDGVLDDAALAQTYIAQAETFEKQAADLRAQAVELDPSTAPKPKQTTRKKTKPAQPQD